MASAAENSVPRSLSKIRNSTARAAFSIMASGLEKNRPPHNSGCGGTICKDAACVRWLQGGPVQQKISAPARGGAGRQQALAPGLLDTMSRSSAGLGSSPTSIFAGPSALQKFQVCPHSNCLPFCATPEISIFSINLSGVPTPIFGIKRQNITFFGFSLNYCYNKYSP